MPEHPLLVFPNPTYAERARRKGGGGRPRVPGAHRQYERLAPQFSRLQAAMDQRRVALQDNTLGIQPEEVLVLETVGSINDFIKAVSRIEGLEWLGEFESDPLDPGDGFEDPKDADKQLTGQLFLVMMDQQALQQMLGYFNQWRENPDLKFPSGLAPLRQAFTRLRAIRHWDVEDRLRETGILADWEDRLTSGEETIPFEAELWFRSDPGRRIQAESYLRSIVFSLGGEVLQQCVIPEIDYHAILGSVPRNQVQGLVQDPATRANARLLVCDQIMFFRPVGQCAVSLPEDMDEVETLSQEVSIDSEMGDPIVALLDGLPLSGHKLLDGRVDIDDPDDYESAYQARDRSHGTMMASLICHGDLDDGGGPVSRRIYARPIMKPQRTFGGQSVESIPQDVVPVDLIHRAVRRLYESEADQAPVAPQVRVVNLSVCDRTRPFSREMSPMARLLDWLAWKYQILFIVSAGNHNGDIELGVAKSALHTLTPVQLQGSVIESIAEDTRNRRILSPAETFNGLTAAAIHQDASTVALNLLINPYEEEGLPSTVSAQGPGYRRTIKPDVLLPGGRQFLTEKLGNAHPKAVLEVRPYSGPPGQRVATPGTRGRLADLCYSRGTSNAAALASRSTMLLYDMIEELRQQSPAMLPSDYDAVLFKVLIVHSAQWTNAWGLYQQILKNGQNSKRFKEYVGRFLGYGHAEVSRVLACTDQRVTILGVGQLQDGDADEFNLPLPPSLSSVAYRRRLTVTLAWLTPVSNKRQNYRIAHLWFNPTRQNTLALGRLYADHTAVQRGTVQHEVLDGDRAVPFQDGDAIAIQVNCRADAGEIDGPIRYALAVTLEVEESLNIPIYEEVRSRLAIAVPVQSVAGTTGLPGSLGS